MKSIFKRSAIGLVIFGIAGSSLAMGWPPQLTGVFVGADGVYLRPQNGDLDYATINLTPSGGFFTEAISPDYQWDWRLYAGLKFNDCDDVTISWLHFNQTFSDFVANPSPIILPRLLPDLTWESVRGKVNFTLDEAYVVWGHTVPFHNPWYLRYAAGVEFANLFTDLTVFAENSEEGDSIAGYKGKTHMEGWGPRFELDVGYHFPCHLQWFTRTNVALLSASRKVELNAKDILENESLFFFDTTFNNRHVVIPKFGMKVGLGWDYEFGNLGAEGCCGTSVAVEIGWQADVYVHAIERPENGFGIIIANGTLLPGDVTATKVSNFSDQGLFVGIKIGTDWLS